MTSIRSTQADPRGFAARRGATTLAALATAALLSVLLPGIASGAVRREALDRSVPAAGIRELSVENVNGDVAISAGAVDTIEIHAEKTARGYDPDQLLRDLRVEIRRVGDRLEITSTQPKRKRFFGLVEIGSSGCCTVRFAIKVPANLGLSAETVNGSIDISDVQGRLALETVNGSIALAGVSGPIDASTVNGSISIGRVGMIAETRVETVNGSVEIAFDRNSGFAYSFETVNGRIESSFPIAVQGKWGPKSAHGHVGTGGATVAAESVNGSIKISGL